jgi:two-component system NtrC family sensor kinase
VRREGVSKSARWLLLALFYVSLLPMSASAFRKVQNIGRADLFVSPDAAGYRVRYVGETARGSGLQRGDVLLLVDGTPARIAGDPSRILAERGAKLSVFRGGRVITVTAAPSSFWDLRYFLLFCVGAAFFLAGWVALVRSGRTAGPEIALFAGFSLAVALVLVITPAPPPDFLYRIGTLFEDLARALFPALLVQLVLTFPRRARFRPTAAVFLPSTLLVAATVKVYFFPTAADAERTIALLDRLQALWMAAAILLAVARLVALSRAKTDLLTEKQLRFLLFGTVLGLLPVTFLDLLPHVFGATIPVLSSLSLLTLGLVPVAFLAALTRYRLWDAEVLGREATALVGAVFVGFAFFTAAQLVLAHPISVGIPYAKGALETTAGLLLALSFVPVRRGISAAIARLQYKDAWKDREGLLALVRELPLPRRLGELEELLTSRVASGLGVSLCALLFARGDAAVDGTKVDGGREIPISELPPEALVRPTRLSLSRFPEDPTASVVRLRRAGFRTVAPLAVSGRLLALFAVSDREGRIPLSRDDEELLETVLAPAALALDHARLYEELQAQADRYRSLKEFHEDVVSGSAAAIAATDELGRFTSLNTAFAKLIGKEERDLVGARDVDVLPAAVLSAQSGERVAATLAAEARILDVAVSVFPGADPATRARVYVLHDATETARLERALADRERLSALGSLSAGVAHEVNTPLAGVAGFARLLLDETPATDPRRQIVEKIERQAFRASRLVGSLLDLARGRPRDMAPLDPCDVVREAARSIEDERAAQDVALAVRVSPGAPRIAGHADGLVQTLMNLLKNAIEAAAAHAGETGGHGEVALEVSASNGHVRIEVADNGPGLTPEQAARIFEPFYSTKKAQGGTGLGLAIASDIIKAHGGSLTVESAPGRGSRFVVSLPALA